MTEVFSWLYVDESVVWLYRTLFVLGLLVVYIIWKFPSENKIEKLPHKSIPEPIQNWFKQPVFTAEKRAFLENKNIPIDPPHDKVLARIKREGDSVSVGVSLKKENKIVVFTGKMNEKDKVHLFLPSDLRTQPIAWDKRRQEAAKFLESKSQSATPTV